MVVPSEKNTDIFSITMENTGPKECALNDSNNEEAIIDSTDDNNKSHEPDKNDDAGESPSFIASFEESEDQSPPNHIQDNQQSHLDSDHELKSIEKDEKLSLCGEGVNDDLSHHSPCDTETGDDDDGGGKHSDNDNVIGDKKCDNISLIEDKDTEVLKVDVKIHESTFFETIDSSGDILDESGDVLDQTEAECYRTSNLILDVPASPPRLQVAKSPLLTSTPHSLPPLSRTRLSSTPLPFNINVPDVLSPSLPPVDSGPMSLPSLSGSGSKSYDYLLKVLLVGDSDVGKQEILSGLEDGSVDSPYCSSTGAAYKTTTILIDGKRVKLQIWDTSGQGRFCTIIRSYSRGAQGILLVYDITNKWSFEGMDRWVREVEEHAPGIPKVLVGNRLHLAFKRQVDQTEAESYAEKNHMGFYEVSPLVNFNITESFQELSRMALKRNGMERLWRSNKVLSLHELCCHSIVARTNVYNIDKLPLPDAIKANLKSYAMTNSSGLRQALNYKTLKDRRKKSKPPDAAGSKRMNLSRKSCVLS